MLEERLPGGKWGTKSNGKYFNLEMQYLNTGFSWFKASLCRPCYVRNTAWTKKTIKGKIYMTIVIIKPYHMLYYFDTVTVKSHFYKVRASTCHACQYSTQAAIGYDVTVSQSRRSLEWVARYSLGGICCITYIID